MRFHTSALLVRRDLLVSLGGFDEARRHAEDLDLWWRIARREPRIVYDPQPTVVVEAGSPDALTRKYREAALDMCDLVERHLVAFDRRAQRRAFQRLARRLLDVYASRALHGGSYDDLLELDRRVGRLLPLRRRFLAAVLRALPQKSWPAFGRMARAPGRILLGLRRTARSHGNPPDPRGAT